MFDFLRLHCQHATAFHQFAEQYNEKHPQHAKKLGAAKLGLISKQQLSDYLLEVAGGTGVSIGNPLARIYDQLIYWDVFSELPFASSGQLYDYQINFVVVQYLHSKEVLENVVKGPGILPPRYYPATAAIIVEKDGNESIGSGSVVSHFGQTFLLTNRHVIDPSEGVRVKRIHLADSVISYALDDPIIAQADDLGALRLDIPAGHPRFYLSEIGYTLQDVLLLGFPKIPFTTRPHLTIHSGEINATIETRTGEEVYLISNYASPGSSGGPLIDYRGLLVGVVSERLEGKYGEELGVFQHSAAVTLERVQKFIQTQVLR